jgi:hypothetical protein
MIENNVPVVGLICKLWESSFGDSELQGNSGDLSPWETGNEWKGTAMFRFQAKSS